MALVTYIGDIVHTTPWTLHFSGACRTGFDPWVDKGVSEKNNSNMDFKIHDHKDWVVVSIGDRLDSFNISHLTQQVKELVGKGKSKLAFDLEQASFLSLPSIKFLAEVAEELRAKNGEFALIGPTEKIKRQIDIFATLNSMRLYRSKNDWLGSSQHSHRPVESEL